MNKPNTGRARIIAAVRRVHPTWNDNDCLRYAAAQVEQATRIGLDDAAARLEADGDELLARINRDEQEREHRAAQVVRVPLDSGNVVELSVADFAALQFELAEQVRLSGNALDHAKLAEVNRLAVEHGLGVVLA